MSNKYNDEKLVFLASHLKSVISTKLIKLILFGSRARKDYNDGSDYDILIVLNEKTDELVDKIRDVEVDFMNQYDMLAAALIFSRTEWEKRINTPIGLNIIREGIDL